jgi:hypothetical protein
MMGLRRLYFLLGGLLKTLVHLSPEPWTPLPASTVMPVADMMNEGR